MNYRQLLEALELRMDAAPDDWAYHRTQGQYSLVEALVERCAMGRDVVPVALLEELGVEFNQDDYA